MFAGDSRGRRPPPGLKGWLFALNRQMDWLLERIQYCEYDETSVRNAIGFTPIERAFLALEDRRFYQHSGIDWFFIPRLARQIATFKRPGGVSTIEQQLVRTLLERRERTLSRKSREMILSWILAHRISKKDIILSYMSNAYLGYRLRGVDQVSRFIFNVDAKDLDLDQAMVVSSMLVYPMPKNVRNNIVGGVDVSANEFLFNTAQLNKKWNTRIRRRVRYGLAFASKIKEPR